MTTDSTVYLETLHEQIDSRFNMEEIQALCFRLGIDYENVPGNTRSAVIRNLIVSLAKANRLQELVVLVRQERPRWNDWQDVPSDFALPTAIAQEDIRQVTQYTVYGDSITVGNITGSSGIAIGSGASASVNQGAGNKETDRPGAEAKPPDPMPEMSGGLETLAEGEAEEQNTKGPINQTRRFEAAMPATVHVDETTELLVMIPRLNSPGLGAFLPLETVGGETIKREDVEGQEAEFQFPSRSTPIVVYISVKVASRDFEVEDGDRSIKIFLDRDGDYETFYMTPLRPASRAPVTIRLYTDKEHEYPVSTIRLDTRVEGGADLENNVALAARIKEVVRYVSGASAITVNIVGGDQISATVSHSAAVVVGGQSSATVAGDSTAESMVD